MLARLRKLRHVSLPTNLLDIQQISERGLVDRRLSLHRHCPFDKWIVEARLEDS